MSKTSTQIFSFAHAGKFNCARALTSRRAASLRAILGVVILLCAATLTATATNGREDAASAQARAATDNDKRAPLVIEGAETSDVFGLGRSVEVRGTVKYGAMAFGGDVVVVGRVEGDVAAIGGNVIQREGAYIGGDVIVLGGAYHHGKTAPERNPASKTVMIAGYEEELGEMLRHPTTLLVPRWSASYLGLRLLAVAFWFICSLALTAAIPDVVGRAATRLQLTSLRVALIGVAGILVIALGVPVAMRLLPPAVGALVVIMATLLALVAYLFGRVVIHATTGRFLQRRLFPESDRSESAALLLGTGFWVLALSIPYVWPVVVIALMMLSLGLALTARYRLAWKPKP